jgi:hypothetical protein
MPVSANIAAYVKKGRTMMTGPTGLSRIFAVGFLCASALLTTSAMAAADDTIVCEPGQIVIDGQCNVPPNPGNHPPDNSGTGDHSGDAGHH